MVYIIVESWFPAAKSSEAGKRWLKVNGKSSPDRSLQKQIMFAVDTTETYTHTISAWEIKEGKEKEALLRITEIMLMFSEISGYKYNIKTYLTAVEAMELFGLKEPEDTSKEFPERYLRKLNLHKLTL